MEQQCHHRHPRMDLENRHRRFLGRENRRQQNLERDPLARYFHDPLSLTLLSLGPLK